MIKRNVIVMKFINTSDEETAETLRKLGFDELPKNGKMFVFINEPNKIVFSSENMNLHFTDKLMF